MNKNKKVYIFWGTIKSTVQKSYHLGYFKPYTTLRFGIEDSWISFIDTESKHIKNAKKLLEHTFNITLTKNEIFKLEVETSLYDNIFHELKQINNSLK